MKKPKNAIRPLKAKTMTLNELQLKTLDLIRHLRFQFRADPYTSGMSDNEFLEKFVDPLESEIYADRTVLRMHRQAKKKKD